MKKANWLFNKSLKLLCNLLILAAPLIIVETASVYFWGESEIPEELKTAYKAN